MQRRPRIKAAANLKSSRRAANKSNSELSKETESEKLLEGDESQSTSIGSINVPATETETIPQVVSECQEKNVEEHGPAPFVEPPVVLPNETGTFKTPLQLPRNENESSGLPAGKARRFKVAPRLNALRNVHKFQECEEKQNKPDENQNEIGKSISTSQELPCNDTLASTNDLPLMLNHNSSTPASPSPFLHHSHNRIRTESLCSMKSIRDVTMANLQPRKNIRNEDQKIIDIKRESRERLSNKDLDKSQLRMFDMIYFNPQNNPMKPRSPHKIETPKKIEITPEIPVIQKEPSAIPVPQLKIDSNGDMVLDETSLVVENEQQKQNRILLANANVVYDDELSGNYGYYKRQKRTKEWPQEETVKFYRCLNTVGTDFSLMLNLFPNRCRRDLKLKFKKEERNNPQLIDKALLKHNIFDLDELQRELDQEEEERKINAANKSKSAVKALVKQKILEKQEIKLKMQKHTSVQKILTGGDLVMHVVDNFNLGLKENVKFPRGTKRQHVKKIKLELPFVGKPAASGFSMDETPSNTVEVIGNVEPEESRHKNPRLGIDADFIEPTLLGSNISSCNQEQNVLPETPVLCVPEYSIESLSVPSSNSLKEERVVGLKMEDIPCTDVSPEIEEDCSTTNEQLLEEPKDPLLLTFLPTESPPRSVSPAPDIMDVATTSFEGREDRAVDNLQAELFDEASFLRSLDLEKLVLVEAQRDGKDVYEIHEIDPVTQEIFDNPIDLPPRFVNLIMGVMLNQENDDE